MADSLEFVKFQLENDFAYLCNQPVLPNTNSEAYQQLQYQQQQGQQQKIQSKEIDIDDQINKLKGDILKEIQQEKEKKQLEKYQKLKFEQEQESIRQKQIIDMEQQMKKLKEELLEQIRMEKQEEELRQQEQQRENQIEENDEYDEEQQEEIPIAEPNQPHPQEVLQIEIIPLQESLLSILNKISQAIRILPKEQYILKDEFIEIIQQLCGNKFNINTAQSLSNYISIDEQTIDWHKFKKSWESFTNYKKQIQLHYTKIYSNFFQQAMRIFPNVNAFERESPHGSFGLIAKEELREFLLNCKGGNIPSGPSFSSITINQIFETLEINEDNQIQLADLLDYLRQFELHGEILKLYIPINQIAIVVEKNIQYWIKDNKGLIDEYVDNREFQQSLRVQDIMQIFEDLGLQVTLLDAIVILNQIGDYNNVENIDGQKVCSELAFWKYIEWLNGIEQEQLQDEEQPIIEPIQTIQPKINGIKKPEPISFQFLETQIIIDLIQMSYFESDKFQLNLQFENTEFEITTQRIQIQKPDQYINGQIPLQIRGVCTLVDKFTNDFKKNLTDRLELSCLNILLIRDNNQISKGSLAIEELFTIDEEQETFFVSIYDELQKNDTTLIRMAIQIKYQIKEIQNQEGFQLFNAEGILQQGQPISVEEIMDIIKPETTHKFQINIKEINWFKKLKFQSLRVKVSLATDKKILKEAIPSFISDEYENDFDLLVEYQVKCDQVLATQISKCLLQIQILLNDGLINLIGYIPIKPIFEEKRVTGEIPLDNNQTGVLVCTLNLDTTYTTDIQVQEEIMELENQLIFKKKIILRIIDFILFDYNNELGEIYFMLVDPINMSESYEIRANTPSIINTQDCIFIMSETDLNDDIIELQVRSVLLGEDKLIGNVQIQISQINKEGIYCESNYLKVNTKEYNQEVSARIGIKLIYVCAKETSNDNYMNVFKYPAIKDLEKQQQNIESYLRNNLHLSFSEINFLQSLIKDNDVFSTQILKPLNIQSQENILEDLLKEFLFYDNNNNKYVNPLHLQTIFGYFNINVQECKDQFIQNQHKRKPFDYECPQNWFDYLTFLAHLQKQFPNLLPLFQIDLQGPIKHELQQVIKQSPIREKKQNLYKELHFHIECGKNLNVLTKRIPNAILKFPELRQETNVFYSSSNPEFDSLISVDVSQFQQLKIQIFDKKYNSANEKEIYSNILIGEVNIVFQNLKEQFPQFIQLEIIPIDTNMSFNQQQQNKIPHLRMKIWTNNEESNIIQQKKSPGKPLGYSKLETVRKLQFDQDDYQNENDKTNNDNATIKNLNKNIEEYLQQMQKPKSSQQDKTKKPINQDEPIQEEEVSKQSVKQQQPKKIEKIPKQYSSSGSSSNPMQPKTSSSGNRLEQINEKLPINGDQLKRIEKILRQNNLQVEKYDHISDDSDYE